MSDELSKGRKHIRNIQLWDTQMRKDPQSCCPGRGLVYRDIGRKPKLDPCKETQSEAQSDSTGNAF